MKIQTTLLTAAAAICLAITAVDVTAAQGMQGGMGSSMMQGGADHGSMGRGMMRGGPATDQGMAQCMMHGGTAGGMMGQHMGRGTTMGSGMMGGMMQGGSSFGMGGLFGSRVTPVMNLSVEDVRGYLTLRLERLKNKRLKVGDVKAADGTVTADIVTVDNSLVQRLKVDQHTGAIEYEN